MTRPLPIWDLLALLSLLPIGMGTLAADASGSEISGKGFSKNIAAVVIPEIYLKYPIEQLEYGFAEGMGSRHREMPQIQFSTEEVSAILSYLGRITGRPPSQRLPANAPRETEPP
jgi:hypothetical protein